MPEPISQVMPSVSLSPALTALDLRMMSREQLLDLYHRLDPPPFEEMHGEFAASQKARAHLHPFILEGPVSPFVSSE